MKSIKQTLCSCGRTAQWIGDLSGEPECWELIDLRRHENDDRVLWPRYYPGQEARHERRVNDIPT